MAKPNLDHPTLPLVKQQFPNVKFLATEFRGQTTLVVPVAHLHDVMAFLRDDSACAYDFLSDVTAVDYLQYPARQPIPGDVEKTGRFAVVYVLSSCVHNRRLIVKALLNPSMDTGGIEEDPSLVLPSVTDLWAGAEWTEREVFDMFGIRFTNHPDLRRILTWEKYPAHPLRKDYPLRGKGEREDYRIIERDSA